MAFIVFLGTGDADGIPALGCPCTNCNMARENKTKQRSWASLFISDGKINIMVDPTPELRSQLIRTGLDKEPIHAIMTTHWHFEHWIGLVELHAWDRKGISGYKPNFDVFMNEYTLSQYKNILPALVDSTNPWLRTRYKIHKVQPGDTFKIGKIGIMVVELDHYIPSIGFIFKLNKNCIAYLVESGLAFPRKTVDTIKESADILILDSSYMSNMQAVNFVKKVTPKIAFTTHIGHRNLPHEELDKTLRIKTNGILRAAHDGLKIDISSGGRYSLRDLLIRPY
jgi:phosphoribosyl 1,2-cyclic phosphate phosphodiesterase